jgi:uncharacterized phage protein gp47/JayE
MAFELTPSGLSTETEDEVKQKRTANLRSVFGVNLDTSTSSIIGQDVNVNSEIEAKNQQVALDIYNSMNPNSAQGTSLDRLAALTGSVRDPATNSNVEGILTFSGAGTVNNGVQINNDDAGTVWEATGGPYVAVGPTTIPATFSAIDTGPLLANANTTWSLITPVPGLTSFTNPNDDAQVGQDQQTDPQFRVSRQIELYSRGQGPKLAITGVVSKVPGVVSARTYHNPATNPVDANGIPFKAFNVVLETNPTPPPLALRESIAEAIFSATGAGGQAFGTDYNLTVTDVEGQDHDNVGFDLVTLQNVYVVMTLSTVGTEQPISPNIEDTVAAAILAHAQENFSGLGQNQLAFEYVGIVADLQEAGTITGITSVAAQLSTTGLGGPFLDPLEISIRERPDFDALNIQVTVTP